MNDTYCISQEFVSVLTQNLTNDDCVAGTVDQMILKDVNRIVLDIAQIECVVCGFGNHRHPVKAAAIGQQKCYQKAFDGERDQFATGEDFADTVVENGEGFAGLDDATWAAEFADADSAIGVEHRAVATTEEHTFAGQRVDAFGKVSSWVLSGVGNVFAINEEFAIHSPTSVFLADKCQ